MENLFSDFGDVVCLISAANGDAAFRIVAGSDLVLDICRCCWAFHAVFSSYSLDNTASSTLGDAFCA